MRITWKRAFDSEADRQDRHESLVRHGVNDRPDNGLEVPPSCYISVDKISYASICKEPDGPGMIIMQDEIANNRRGDQAGKCKDIWDGVDVLMRSESCQNFEKRPLGIIGWFSYGNRSAL
jgi:hypothetical protein